MLAAGSLSVRLALDVQSAQAMRAGARSGDPETLRAAAKQFEAMMVQTMLKNMRESSFSQEGDVFGNSPSTRMYRDMLDQQWAQAMVQGRGLGFADMMVKAMEARSGAVMPSSDPMPNPEQGLALPPPHLPSPMPRSDKSVNAPRPLEPDPASDRRQPFLNELRPHAEAISAETGIPAAHILAHAALETGWGQHKIRNADGSDSHNLFGIKSGKSWQGEVTDQQTTEYRYGLPMKRVETFRAYPDYSAALRDYADLLQRRYADAISAGPDSARFAQALADGGYATDPAYAGKLKGVVDSVARLTAS